MRNEESDKQKALQNQIKQDLERLLKETKPAGVSEATGSVLAIGDNGGDPFSSEKAAHPNARPMDFHREKKTAEREARKIVSAAMKLYVDQKFIGKDEYLEFKKNVDAMTLASLMTTMSFTQHAIIKIMEDIDMGNTHPRTLEALATLNNQLMSAVKHLAAFQATIENSMRQAQVDLTVAEHRESAAANRTEDADAVIVHEQPSRVRGTRNIIKAIAAGKSESEKPETPPALTNPFTRPENPFQDEKEKEENKDNIIDASDYGI